MNAVGAMEPIPFSEARARLPELVHRAARNPGEIVIITHRDLAVDVALVSMAYVRGMEDRLAELREQLGPPFRLEGAFSTDHPADDLDAALAALFEGRSPSVAPGD